MPASADNTWAPLSDEAKSILEWVEDMRGKRRNILQLEVEKLPLKGDRPIPGMDKPVTAELLEEIVAYTATNSELGMVENNGLVRIGFRDLIDELTTETAPAP